MKLNTKIPNMNPISYADILFRKDKRKELFLELTQNERINFLQSATKAVKKDLLIKLAMKMWLAYYKL